MNCSKCGTFTRKFFLVLSRTPEAMITGAAGAWVCKECFKKELE
jgi:hypothetical protein